MSSTFQLLTAAESSPKLAHELGLTLQHESAVLYLAPHTFAGRGNLCAGASAGCINGCLGLYSGRADIVKRGDTSNTVRDARIRKAQLFFDDFATFKAQLVSDIAKHVKRCHKNGKLPAVRLNGSSDVPWERIIRDVFEQFADVTFYDYTKLPPSKRQNLPKNYTLTFSYSGENLDACGEALRAGWNVAAVLKVAPSEAMPLFLRDLNPWHPLAALPVIDGDVHDQRFLDPKGVIVGLRPKGRLRKARTSFVIGSL
jgi:hypothetical protein